MPTKKQLKAFSLLFFYVIVRGIVSYVYLNWINKFYSFK